MWSLDRTTQLPCDDHRQPASVDPPAVSVVSCSQPLRHVIVAVQGQVLPQGHVPGIEFNTEYTQRGDLR